MGIWEDITKFVADATGATWQREVAAGMHKEYVSDLQKAQLAGIYDPTRYALDQKARRAAIAAQERITTKEVFEAEERDRQAKIKTLEIEAAVDKDLNEVDTLLEGAKTGLGIAAKIGWVSPIIALGANLLLGLNKYLPEMSPEQRVRYEETKAIQDKYTAIHTGAVAEAKIREQAQEKAITNLTNRINSGYNLSTIKSIQSDINADPYLTATNKNTLLQLASNKGEKIRAAKPLPEPVSLTAFETRPTILAGVSIMLAILIIIVVIALSGG